MIFPDLCGQWFGTLLVSLESHRVIDLLPDRRTETCAQWMQQRPEITGVSRDRGGEYASAASTGAPQAIQIADRLHVCKNLTEATQLLSARCQAEIVTANKTAVPWQTEQATLQISIQEWRPLEPARARKSSVGSQGWTLCTLSAGTGFA